MKFSIKYATMALILVPLSFHGHSDNAHEVVPAARNATVTASALPASGGYLVNVDPVTHEFTEQPPVIPPEDLPPGVSSSHEGLVQRRNADSGGWMVDLQGRFQNLQVATVDANGRVSVTCLSDSTYTGKARVDSGRE